MACAVDTSLRLCGRLLLVFRTNASYERWDGARKMIGVVKNRSEARGPASVLGGPPGPRGIGALPPGI